MKIIKIILVMFIAIFALTGSVMAYSTDAYSIEVPSTYIEKTDSTTATQVIFVKDEVTALPNFNVYSKKERSSGTIKNTSDADISKVADELCNYIYSTYGITADVIKKEKITFNGYDAVFVSTKWNSKSTLGYDIYQDQYTMLSKNYVYTLTFQVKDETELGSAENIAIKNSFVIKDDLQRNSGIDFGEVLRTGIIGAIVAVIVGFVANKKKGN